MSLSREQMLVEMGIKPLWVLREQTDPSVVRPVAVECSAPIAPPLIEPTPVAVSARHESLPGHAGESAGIVPSATMALTPAVHDADWTKLEALVADCRACELCKQRKQAVLGTGDRNPAWLFIGEGPGAEEDAKGEPFVGQAGKLLDSMLAALDIARGDGVYIANAVKCRPPGNRTPEAVEMATCRPYLEQQIALLQPKVIVLLGKAAVHSILHEDKALAVLRGRCFEYAGIPVIVTYHPAYLLRNLPDKAKAWEDLLLARRTLRAQAELELPF